LVEYLSMNEYIQLLILFAFYGYLLIFQLIKNTKLNKLLENLGLAFFIYTLFYSIYIIIINNNIFERIDNHKAGHSLVWFIFSIFYIVNYKGFPILKTIFFIISYEFLWYIVFSFYYNNYYFIPIGIFYLLILSLAIFNLVLEKQIKPFLISILFLILFYSIWIFKFNFIISVNIFNAHYDNFLSHIIEIGSWFYYFIIITILQKINSKKVFRYLRLSFS
jgi:hypothetical protein